MKATSTLMCWLTLCIAFATTSAFAQDAKFGKISDEELRMTQYPQDTAADAIVLSDIGYSRFSFAHKTQVFTERHIRIKILKKSGYDWADFAVPYYMKGADKEKVVNVRGFTYNLENGQVQKYKLEAKSMFDEQHNENWYSKKFTMPNVKVGSVIDVEYTIISDFAYNLREWEFQTTIPTLWSEYRAEIPDIFNYKFLMQGYHPLYNSDKSNKATGSTQIINYAYTWAMKDIPALREESYITTMKDFQAKIEFELQQVRLPGQAPQTMTGNWDDVTRDLLLSERFGEQLNRSGYYKNELALLTAQHKTKEELVQAIYNHVKDRMTWNGKYHYLATNTLRKAYDTRTGSAADINLMLVAMLQEASFDANPVLVSTRSNGRPPKGSPLINKFNYVLAHVVVDGKEILLDATEPLMPFGMLPVRALNDEGHLIKRKENRWVALKPANYSQFITTDVTFSPTGELLGKTTESAGGYYALSLRKTLAEEGEDKFAERLTREIGNYKLGKPSFGNTEKISEPFQINYDISSGGTGQLADIIYLSPLLGHGKKQSPFKLNERQYPVDFASPIDETIITKFTIPAGYVIDEAPKGSVISLPENGGRFTFIVQQDGNMLQVMSRISINKPVFYAPEYTFLKEFYNQIIAKHAEQIVLKKATAN
ncbi:DUF3857 domain-containing protein [Pontibacter sp. Tf4]|uniref:DUF3857 domain-containing protein n=1 Tax=Pontibacter sp. Tf4 TaxID=2761620 RepID=UPI00162AB92C|nr:DUF3857 domain-containing protein [Pontibacter sp. Tf4]MBB6612326.1 DUF3857 domain-containing protein [Pontibacter sp. Tf4]